MDTNATFPTIPGITLTTTLGHGAFGAVYGGRHHTLDADVAVKVVPAGDFDPAGLNRVLGEARLMARLDHPNLLRVFDAGTAGRNVYFVLELMDGGTLRDHRPLPADRAVTVARQLLSGVQALHAARILHRDIKPANCLCRAADGRVKLADLGIATDWQTRTGRYDFGGTPAYMAPELFDARPQFSPLSDLYALGMTLAAAVLDANPFPAGVGDQWKAWAESGTRPHLAALRPDLPPAFCELVGQMMAARADDRPASADAALAALAVTDRRPAGSPPAPPRSDAERFGVWVVGSQQYSSSNWLGHAVSHSRTGAAGRLMRLKAAGPIGGQSEPILAAAERAARLTHPNLVDVLDWGRTDDGQAFVVTSATGRTMQDELADGRRVDESMALVIAAAAADALSYIHAAGLTYQLIDPGTIYLARDARTPQLGWPVFCVPVGSPLRDAKGRSNLFFVDAYAAPEVRDRTSKTIETPTDVYAVGNMLTALVAGREVYFDRRANGQFPTQAELGVTAPFARLIGEMTEADAGRRPTAVAVAQEVRRIAGRLGVPLSSG